MKEWIKKVVIELVEGYVNHKLQEIRLQNGIELNTALKTNNEVNQALTNKEIANLRGEIRLVANERRKEIKEQLDAAKAMTISTLKGLLKSRGNYQVTGDIGKLEIKEVAVWDISGLAINKLKEIAEILGDDNSKLFKTVEAAEAFIEEIRIKSKLESEEE